MILTLALTLLPLACGGSEPPPATQPQAAADVPSAPAGDTPAAEAPATAAGETTPPGGTDALPPKPGSEGELVEIEPPQDASEPLDLPTFADDLGGGDTVTVTVRLEGGDRGELTFQTIQDGRPEMVHIEIVEGSTEVAVQAPARWPTPVYVAFAAAADPAAGLDSTAGIAAGTPGRQAAVQVGGAAEPVTLAGQDVELSITVGDKPDWLTRLATQGPVPFGGTPPGAPPQGG